MAFDRTKEPAFQSKIRIATANGKNANLYDASGTQQNNTRPNGEEVTVFEVKEANGHILYRIGGQNEWLAKEDSNWKQKEPQPKKVHFTNIKLSDEIIKKPTNPDVSIKKGLLLKQNSPVPNQKEIRKIFKHGKSFPEDTKFEWIYAPDTKQSKYTNAKVKVTFPNGFSATRTVHYNIQSMPQSQKTTPPLAAPKLVNPRPRDLNFEFVKSNQLIQLFAKSVDEALLLYEQGLYKQMSNTIRQGLEILTDKLLVLNGINSDLDWERANLSNKLGYIAYLKVLPQRIMNLCFSIKNYGNIGSHNNNAARFNQASALTDLQQYHDLLIYLSNTYQGTKLPYADVQISDEQNKHRNWYQRPMLNFNQIISFHDYLYQKEHPRVKQEQIVAQPEESVEPEPQKMGKGMKFLTYLFIAIIVVIAGGIGYEAWQMHAENNASTQKKLTIKQQARNLSKRQKIALSLVYANNNLDDQWSEAFNQVKDNNYNISRYKDYKFDTATVSATGSSYLYILEKNLGFGFQDRQNGDSLVEFMSVDSSDDSEDAQNNLDRKNVYTYQMLKEAKNSGQWSNVKKIAKKLTFTNEEIE